MPKIRVLAVGLTHKDHPGKRFDVEEWTPELPERWTGVEGQFIEPEHTDPRTWFEYVMERDEFMEDPMELLKPYRATNANRTRIYRIVVPSREPEINEYGEVAP